MQYNNLLLRIHSLYFLFSNFHCCDGKNISICAVKCVLNSCISEQSGNETGMLIRGGWPIKGAVIVISEYFYDLPLFWGCQSPFSSSGGLL